MNRNYFSFVAEGELIKDTYLQSYSALHFVWLTSFDTYFKKVMEKWGANLIFVMYKQTIWYNQQPKQTNVNKKKII